MTAKVNGGGSRTAGRDRAVVSLHLGGGGERGLLLFATEVRRLQKEKTSPTEGGSRRIVAAEDNPFMKAS